MKPLIYVLAGGPNTGKTAVLKELKRRGYKTLPEASRLVYSKDKRFIGKSVKEINIKQFQDAIFDLQKKETARLVKVKKQIVFSDRGFGDTLAYYKHNKLFVPKEKLNYTKNFRYAGIFIFDFLNFYEKDLLRQESKEEQKRIQEMIIQTYNELNYDLTTVPFMPVEKRADFILSKILPHLYNLQ